MEQDSWEFRFYDFVKDWISKDPEIKVKTSGSTGEPKMISLFKKQMIQSAFMTGEFLGLQIKQKALCCLPVEYIAGKMMVVRAFVLGLNLVKVKPSGNPLENINEDFDFAAMTPHQVFNILHSSEGEKKLNKIKNLIIGGADISFNLLQKIRQLKNNTFHTYGMTETITHVAMKKLTGTNPGACFNALPGVRFSTDEKNCLVIHAPHLSEKSIITNDIVDLVNASKFNYVGRYDNIINSGGIKISPELVENKLLPFLKCRFIISGIPDEKLGQRLVLVVEGAIEPPAVFDRIYQEAKLDRYEIPKQIFHLNHFEETESGK
ncbi:MAG: AMP-binding protein, partial [Bacteroidales bacterium]|nr:AMP-binding protein [Bacteroidales bacterium]